MVLNGFYLSINHRMKIGKKEKAKTHLLSR